MFDAVINIIKENTALIWYEKEKNCIICGKKSDTSICAICREVYVQPEQPRCISCGKILSENKSCCKDCEMGKGPKGLCKVISFGQYDGVWKEFIQSVKFKGQPYLLSELSEELTSWVVKQLPPPDGIVPVPMSVNRLGHRGFNQAEVLASLLCRKLGISYLDILFRVKETLSQTSLGRSERLKNLQGVFAIKPGIKTEAEVIWLVDDVVTTGATLRECAGVLKENGISKVYALCLGAGKEE